MPKVFSDEERAYIDKRLREEAAYCLMTFGVKGTTVDELVKRVNIPKGTFYLFYDSKESLLFQALLTLHEQMEQTLFKRIGDLPDKRDVEAVTDVVLELYVMADRSGLLRMMTTGELEIIYRKLPVDSFQGHLEHDSDTIRTIFNMLNISTDNIDHYAAAFRSQFITMIYKREMGEDKVFAALRLCIRGLILQMFE
ncbi:TetR/AcrR family transcriptional regulator [Anaerolentibacter hominis]|uniref:TetR/AcrR family transcriptional regulator n=1 Tax=Anaerolentibacter hominis TaxID=3079009 RepID=UPI0031B82E70